MKSFTSIAIIVVSAIVVIVAIGTGAFLIMNASPGRDAQDSPSRSERLQERLEAPSSGEESVSLKLSAGEPGTLEHDSGARMEIPQGALTESVTVSITEVEPPPSPMKVGRAFDFSVGGELTAPVTIHIPFELEPGQDASSVHALHWNEQAVGWEPVDGKVDEAAGAIAVTTDRLSVFSSIWVRVEASCTTDPVVMRAGETLRVISTVKNLGTPIDVYMTPSIVRVGDALGDDSLGRTEVDTIYWNQSSDLKHETVQTAPGDYRVECRIFWVTFRAGTQLVSRELVIHDLPSAIVTVRRDVGPTSGAYLRIERIEDLDPTIYPGNLYSVLVDVGNAGDERSGRFDLVMDFTRDTGGQTTRLHYSGVDNRLSGWEDEVGPRSTDSRRGISVNVPGDLPSGRYGVCVRIEPVDSSEADSDGGACLDRYVLSRSEDAMAVKVSPIDTRDGQRAWAALPKNVSTVEVVREAIEFAELHDDRTLRTIYKQLAGELAFRKAVEPGPERRHVLLEGLKPGVEIAGYITDACLQSGFDCTGALKSSGLLNSELLTKFPAVPNEAVSFVGQSVSGALLFYDAYYTMLVNQALDLDQALGTLDGLEKLPLGRGDENIWKLAVADARKDVEATASSDNWKAFAAAIYQNRGDFLQFAGTQTVSGLAHAAAKSQMLHHAGIAGQKAMIPALGLKTSGLAATGPTAFVASVSFAAEVYRSIEDQEDQIGTAALAAFVNAAFSDPAFLESVSSDPEEQANLREALAYAKYLAYDNLYKAEEGWLNWLSAWVKSYAQDRDEFLKYMDTGREQALEELLRLLSDRGVAPPPTPPGGPAFARNPALDFDTLAAAGNHAPEAVWPDGTTMWVSDSVDRKIYAYNLVTRQRDSAKDFDTLSAAGNSNPHGIWSDGTTMWVADIPDHKIFAYNLVTKQWDPGKDINALADAGNHGSNGIWSDGTTMWVADWYDGKLYAYDMTTKQWDSDKDFNTLNAAGNSNPDGVWSDGTTMWVADAIDSKIYAYNLVTRQRDDAKDFNTLGGADNHNPAGIWSDGTTMWVADWGDHKIFAYNMPGMVGDTATTDEEDEGLGLVEPVRLAHGEYPVWSPDGQQIAFVSWQAGNSDIYVVNADGSNLTQLTDNEAGDRDPVWSPDGQRIAYVSLDRKYSFEHYHDLRVVNSDGADDVPLIARSDDVLESPSWSPDGRYIAFEEYDAGRNPEIAVIDLNSGSSDTLTFLTKAEHPKWSPDSQRILFQAIDSSIYSSEPDQPDVFIMYLDGSGRKNLTDDDDWDMFPSWSPDGRRIAFASDRDGDYDIYTMNPDGSNLTQLTDDPMGDLTPSWSPDGQRIAFASNRDGDRDIYVMNADGSSQTRLTDFPGGVGLQHWSPDGQRIAFDAPLNNGTKNIYVINLGEDVLGSN